MRPRGLAALRRAVERRLAAAAALELLVAVHEARGLAAPGALLLVAEGVHRRVVHAVPVVAVRPLEQRERIRVDELLARDVLVLELARQQVDLEAEPGAPGRLLGVARHGRVAALAAEGLLGHHDEVRELADAHGREALVEALEVLFGAGHAVVVLVAEEAQPLRLDLLRLVVLVVRALADRAVEARHDDVADDEAARRGPPVRPVAGRLALDPLLHGDVAVEQVGLLLGRVPLVVGRGLALRVVVGPVRRRAGAVGPLVPVPELLVLVAVRLPDVAALDDVLDGEQRELRRGFRLARVVLRGLGRARRGPRRELVLAPAAVLLPLPLLGLLELALLALLARLLDDLVVVVRGRLAVAAP